MFPSETTILMAIAVSKDTGKELLTRPMDVMGEYIGYLYDSLVSRGCLSGNRSRGYHLYEVGANLGRVCIPPGRIAGNFAATEAPLLQEVMDEGRK